MGGKRWSGIRSGVVALSLLAAACGGTGGGAGGGSGQNLAGDIAVSGSSTVEPITSLVAELFAEENPNVSITVDGPGTGDGFELFCSGETAISDASRPIEPEEAQACKQSGIEYTELEIALDGITVMTNPANNAVTCLNSGDLYALVGPESKGFENWSDADQLGREVGGIGVPYPDLPLEVTAPGEESGTYDAFIELAGFEDIGVERGLSEEEAATTRPDYQASPDDNVIIQAIEGSDGSFGWVGLSFYENNKGAVKGIEIDGGDGCVAPGFETVADGTYPLSRSLYIYVNDQLVQQSDALQAFVDFYMTDTGLKTAVQETQYVVLPQERIDATRETWKKATAA